MTSITKQATGYEVRWRTPSGGSGRKTFARKADAERHKTKIDNAKNSGGYVDPSRARETVGAMADQWLDAKLGLAPKTRERYEGIITRHIQPQWGKVRLSDVTHSEVQRWLARLDLAPASVRKVHRVMSTIMAFAVKDGRLSINPAAGVSLPRVPKPEKRFLTHQQVDELAGPCGDQYRLVVLFLAYTGLRWGEMAALRVHRIDFLRRRVLVAESVTPVRGVMTFGPTKGHERRDVTIPRFLIEELAQHVTGKSPNDLVFTGLRGNPLRSQIFQRTTLDQACDQSGIPRIAAHELRHSAASLAIASGADVKIIQRMLGHKSATMTLDQYGHLFGDRLDVVADAMDAARASALGTVSEMCQEAQVVQLR